MKQGKLTICKTTRQIAADTLFIALKKLLSSDKQISEVDLRDAWLFELRKHKEIFPEGWYIPPPHGIGVLFDTDKDSRRLNFLTLRDENYWPKETVFLDRLQGMITLYTSPVHKDSGIIGDFGMTLYFGKKKEIQNHLKNIYSFDKEIFAFAKEGMMLKDLYNFATTLFQKKHYTNSGWLSQTDPTGINIGHTIPWSNEEQTREERNIIKKGSSNWKATYTTISKKRGFLNAVEETKIQKNMAFTIEPRLQAIGQTTIPTAYFHNIAILNDNGEKELLTNFDKIFQLVGMEYMLSEDKEDRRGKARITK